MKRVVLGAVLVLVAATVLVMAQEAVKGSVCYVCEKCGMSAVKAGQCCEQDMAALKVLAVQDGKATVCSCAADCQCTGVKADDATQCDCGKAVKTVDLKGKFVCADGKCLTIADAAGQCACGKDLVEVK